MPRLCLGYQGIYSPAAPVKSAPIAHKHEMTVLLAFIAYYPYL